MIKVLQHLSASSVCPEAQTMNFKLEVVLEPLFITIHQPYTLSNLDHEEHTAITIRPLERSELELSRHQQNFMCTAIMERNVSSHVHEVFARLANGLMPEDFDLSKHPWVKNIDSTGRVKGNSAVSRQLFPKDFQDLCSAVHHELSDLVKRAVKLLRWRMAIRGSHNPILSSCGASWSFDDRAWYPLPDDIRGEIELHVAPRISDKVHRETETMIKTGLSEPLGHELFLEAWQLRRSNPRSALIIGMAAAEVGFKQCIGKLVPHAEWLANNVPSPPLDKMLSQYLPQLPTKLTIEGKVLKPSKRIRRAIKEGIDARNLTVHRGGELQPTEQLKEILLSVRDLLYLLDYYCGFGWALDYIRDEIRQEMVTEFDLKTTKPFSVIELG